MYNNKFFIDRRKVFHYWLAVIAWPVCSELIISEVKNRLVISLPYFPFPERSQRPEAWPSLSLVGKKEGRGHDLYIL
jgi:hypothetical protein